VASLKKTTCFGKGGRGKRKPKQAALFKIIPPGKGGRGKKPG